MVTRVLVEKKQGFRVEAEALKHDINEMLGAKKVAQLRLVNCYDIEGPVDERVKHDILSEPNVDILSDQLELSGTEIAFRMAYLPGQFDQRADSAGQCIEIVTLKARPEIMSSKMIVLSGDMDAHDLNRIKAFLINPVEAHEVSMDVPQTVKMQFEKPSQVPIYKGFITMSPESLEAFRVEMGLAMTEADLKHVQHYFSQTERRDPTETEIKVIDTYWSDHCRHTTFMTPIRAVDLPEIPTLKKAYASYMGMREAVYGEKDRDVTLMDLATINTKALRKQGGLTDLDVSDEINACSIEVTVDVDGIDEPWLLMFKNETHNHPTEIEPFGGAATCLGGAIRDPLSGRSYVYQSMRVTGAANPNTPISETIEGKLPQKVITQKAAAGFSAYGNQIGLATGHVAEVYDDGFLAKRMEVGAVIGAAPKAHVVRKHPSCGDLVMLIGGRTGRDGIGGATGSSKAHDEESLLSCGAEVQKGNPPEERKIQRLFRRPDVTQRIKKCNDFGAGGVCVAIGELSDSLDVQLDAVLKKYEGLNGTEIAISESQERMAVVISSADRDAILQACDEENLEAVHVATVTDTGRLVMSFQGECILNVSRAFLDTNGVKGEAKVLVTPPAVASYFNQPVNEDLSFQLSDLNICSQKGLVERFDNTIGSGTVMLPFGGKYALTPAQTMVAKLPVLHGETTTVSMMSYGYDPEIGKWSPFHGGQYAVVDAVTKIVATGGCYSTIRLSLQEYFEKLGNQPEKWGKPFAALLGASLAQTELGIAAIGGKDSMSGTFKDIHVPPTLIAFAVDTAKATDIVTPELKQVGSLLYAFVCKRTEDESVDYDALKAQFQAYFQLRKKGCILSSYAAGRGGIAVAAAKMAMGNGLGVTLTADIPLYAASYGSIVFETDSPIAVEGAILIGKTTDDKKVVVNGTAYALDALRQAFESTLSDVFPVTHDGKGYAPTYAYTERLNTRPLVSVPKPRVFIPVFPGTNCEYDTQRAFEKAGGLVETLVFRNKTPQAIRESIEAIAKGIERANIIALPGGFSAGDEPEGSGKFIASVLRNPRIAEALMRHLNQKDGLMIGICNGFQALVKLGLLPYGAIKPLSEESPTLTFNAITRHVARMANVRVASVKSPWFSNVSVGDVFQTAFSHGEGRFYASDDVIKELALKGQVATQYVDDMGMPTYEGAYNINGSAHAIEGITSEDGRVLGKMGHIERVGKHLYKNSLGETDMRVFEAGIHYFK